jgi:LmbE family N-acetylglucosaminyl deacetylase
MPASLDCTRRAPFPFSPGREVLAMIRCFRTAILCVLAALVPPAVASAQITPLDLDRGASGLGLAVRQLGRSGGVLYITAHPDDENNGVLVRLTRGLGLRTGLLTVTRGDGGQNEIGPELFQAIGILRTEELAAVHRYGGSEQFFTSAYEFGYSFSVEETFQKWGEQEILADVVRVIRAFRPDVILTLPLEAEGGGQHHQATARLGRDAFRAAADPTRFPEQLKAGLQPWQARKVYQGGVGGGPLARGNELPAGAVVVDTSSYDPLLGMSWHQLGMLGRRNHKCQGMGQLTANASEGRGVYLLVDSEPAVVGVEKDILDGVETSLSGVARFANGQEAKAPFLLAGLQAIEGFGEQARAAFDPLAPQKAVAPLARGLAALRELAAKVKASGLDARARHEIAERLTQEEADFERALGLAQGLDLMLSVDDGDAVRGQTLKLTARVSNQSSQPVAIADVPVAAPAGWTVKKTAGEPGTLAAGATATWAYDVVVGPAARYSQPYWKRNLEVDRYDMEIPGDLTKPWSAPDVAGEVRYTADGVQAALRMPAIYRYEGRWVGGEKQKVLNVVPALSVKLTPQIAVIPVKATAKKREFRVTLLNNAKQASQAMVRLELPAGWSAEPPQAELPLRYEGEEVSARFFVTPPAGLAEGEFAVKAVATRDGQEFREGYQVIAYDHTQERHLFHEASSRVKVIDVAVAPYARVGYVSGAGDEVPDAIRQLGIPLDFLGADELAYGDLSKYTTIVTGIRAYQTRADLKASNNRLLDFARAGGHLVVQYNKFEFNVLSMPAQPGGFGFGQLRAADSPYAPYPASVSSDRVTVEEAPVKLLVPGARQLMAPNTIASQDFDGWVQERGLYFLKAKDARYVDLLAASDPWPKNPGEKKGMLTTAPLGKGSWTYVGLGLWRQLPAGTTGAYRILANLLSQPRGQ